MSILVRNVCDLHIYRGWRGVAPASPTLKALYKNYTVYQDFKRLYKIYTALKVVQNLYSCNLNFTRLYKLYKNYTVFKV